MTILYLQTQTQKDHRFLLFLLPDALWNIRKSENVTSLFMSFASPDASFINVTRNALISSTFEMRFNGHGSTVLSGKGATDIFIATATAGALQRFFSAGLPNIGKAGAISERSHANALLEAGFSYESRAYQLSASRYAVYRGLSLSGAYSGASIAFGSNFAGQF